MDIKGKSVVITGAARGLGAAMAGALGERGARLALVDLDPAALEAQARTLRRGGARVQTYEVDVADETQVQALFNGVSADFGGVDAVVNNAGILRDALLIKSDNGRVTGRMSLEQWQAVIDVNLTGVFLCGREAARHMVEGGRRGLIVNISSISRAGNAGQSNYSAAKAGVAALTVVWAKELARYGIRANSIAPGFVNTELVASMQPEARQRMTAMIPLKRMAEPEEVAHTLLYLFENDYVNGRCIEIDGGMRL